ncbi:hypothetical protein ACQRKX_001797 [Enterobacter cloacae]|uniref:hypothetical protein n=1 Tax=Enterobacter kobei TaxID=208224 RepID=UPI003CE9D94F
MSRPELDGRLAALSRLNGSRSGKKDTTGPARQTFKSLRKPRKKGKSRNGR